MKRFLTTRDLGAGEVAYTLEYALIDTDPRSLKLRRALPHEQEPR